MTFCAGRADSFSTAFLRPRFGMARSGLEIRRRSRTRQARNAGTQRRQGAKEAFSFYAHRRPQTVQDTLHTVRCTLYQQIAGEGPFSLRFPRLPTALRCHSRGGIGESVTLILNYAPAPLGIC